MHVLLTEVLPQIGVLAAIAAACLGWGRVAFHLGRNLARRRRSAAAPPAGSAGVDSAAHAPPPAADRRAPPRGGIGLDFGRSDAAFARLVWPLAMGYSVTASVLGLLGSVGLLHPLAFALVTLGGCGCAAHFLAEDLRRARTAVAAGRPEDRRTLPLWSQFALAAGVIGGAAVLCSATLPSTTLDALSYGFHLPRRILEEGALPAAPDLDESFDPQLGFLGLAWGMALGGPLGAQAAAVFWAGLFVFAVYEAARLWLPPRWAVFAGAAAALIPAVQAAGSAPLFDAGGAAFFTLGWTAWRRARRPKCSPGWSILAGWMLGTAVALQPRMILPTILLAAFTALELLAPGRSGLPRRGLKPILLGLASALVVVGPWLVRAAVLSGEPFHPFQATVFGLSDRDGGASQRPLGRSLGSVLQAPLAMGVAPETFRGREQQLGPLLLAVWPAVLLCRRRKVLGWLALWSAAYLVIWLGTRQNLRFFLPAAPWAVVAAAIVLRRLTHDAATAFWNRGVAFVLALLAFLPLGLDLRRAAAAAQRIAANESLQDRLVRTEPTAAFGIRCEEALRDAGAPTSAESAGTASSMPGDSAAASTAAGDASASPVPSPQPVRGRGAIKILSQEARAYFVPGEVVWEPYFRGRTKWGMRKPTSNDARAYFQRLKAEGFTYVLLAQTDPVDVKEYDPTLGAWVRQADREGLSLPVVAEVSSRGSSPPRRYQLREIR